MEFERDIPKSRSESDDELRLEHNLEELLKGGVRGKYVERYRTGTNLVLLDPDVASAFPSSTAVHEALQLVMQLTELQHRQVTSTHP